MKVKVGDKFRATIESPDPFRDSIVVSGMVIDRKGSYVKYVDELGDTGTFYIEVYEKYGKIDIN